MFIVIYRPHNELICHTQYIGPFAEYADADATLCVLPALGWCDQSAEQVVRTSGVKFIQELVTTAAVALANIQDLEA